MHVEDALFRIEWPESDPVHVIIMATVSHLTPKWRSAAVCRHC